MAAAVVVAIGLLPGDARSQSTTLVHTTPVPSVRAVPLDAPVTVDGRLDEAVWRSAPAATEFRQSQPHEGEPATQRTEVRFANDAEALYVGARMYDDLGAAGVRTRLARRDATVDSDELTLVFDPYHDHLTRVEFKVNPSGVKYDAYGPGGAGMDASWDPVWDVATRIDSLGWTAEIRIPFSQLNFSSDSTQTWGLQIVRLTSRLNERVHWSFWRLNETGGPSRYGHLEGIEVRGRSRGLEISPYIVGRSTFLGSVDSDNPFADPRSGDVRVGADFRYRLTSNLTLVGTINPDFGQVEVDPAVVNLSAFETFYDEKRPFFVEGRGLFSFGGLSCFFCSNVSSLLTFYSRRIGRAPEAASLAEDAGEYADIPANTAILGAAKVTGRTAKGTSIAVLDAVTRREVATVATGDGGRLEQEVAPLSNFLVGRVKQELRGGNLTVGGVFSSIQRRFDDPRLAEMLTRHAEVVGVDTDAWWGGRTYHLMASAAISQVTGEPEAIHRLQRSSARYFHRPDRKERGQDGFFSEAYDPDATVMRGYGAYARLAKDAGDWLWEVAGAVRSPGFETNDVAFLTTTDYVWLSANLLRQYTTPTSWYRSLTLIAGGQQQSNYDGDVTQRQLHAYIGGQLPNYWRASAFYIYWPDTYDDRLTRGGPVVQLDGGGFASASLTTDTRKAFYLDVASDYGWRAGGRWSWGIYSTLTYRPAPNVSLSLGPSFTHVAATTQYVRSWDDPTAEHFHGKRYLFSDLRRQTVSMNTRLNVTFTPALTLELFAQPYISAGKYLNFQEFAAPRSSHRLVYGEDIGTVRLEDGRYTVDPDGEAGAAPSQTFRNPDFNFRSLRGNAVLRWEWRPGSTLYLVWQQDRSNEADVGDLRLGRDQSALFRAPADNVLVFKVSYWMNP